MEYKTTLETGHYNLTGESVKLKPKRGKDTWTYIYVWFAIIIGCESAIISELSDYIDFRIRIALLLGSWSLTGWLFLQDSWFKNKLVIFKTKIEDQFE